MAACSLTRCRARPRPRLGCSGATPAFFGSNTMAMPLVIIVQVWQNLGFTMAVFIGGLKTIPHSVFEAANLDGVTRLEAVHRNNMAHDGPRGDC